MVRRKGKYISNRNQGYMHHQKQVFPPHRALDTPNTPVKRDYEFKSHLVMMIEDFKNDINHSFKEIQARQWWSMPLIPVIGRQRQADF